jgi:hypothetical protein
MHIAVMTPHQLAPTMGQLRVGTMILAAFFSLIYNSSAHGEQIPLWLPRHHSALDGGIPSFQLPLIEDGSGAWGATLPRRQLGHDPPLGSGSFDSYRSGIATDYRGARVIIICRSIVSIVMLTMPWISTIPSGTTRSDSIDINNYSSSTYMAHFQCTVIDPTTGIDDGIPATDGDANITNNQWTGNTSATDRVLANISAVD